MLDKVVLVVWYRCGLSGDHRGLQDDAARALLYRSTGGEDVLLSRLQVNEVGLVTRRLFRLRLQLLDTSLNGLKFLRKKMELNFQDTLCL